MCLYPIYNVIIGFTALDLTPETLKIFNRQLWHTPGHRLAAEAGLMELSRALHLPGSIQWVTEWVSELCLCTRHDTVAAGKWTYILLQYILWAEPWSLRSTSLGWQQSEVTAPSSLLSGRDQYLIGNTWDEMTRWHNNLWAQAPLMRRAIYLSQGARVAVLTWSKCSEAERVWARRGMLSAFMEP